MYLVLALYASEWYTNIQYIILKTRKISKICKAGISDPHIMFMACANSHGEDLVAGIASSIVSFAVSSPSGVSPLLLLRWAGPSYPNLRNRPGAWILPELAWGRLEPPRGNSDPAKMPPQPTRRYEYEYLLLVFWKLCWSWNYCTADTLLFLCRSRKSSKLRFMTHEFVLLTRLSEQRLTLW